MRTYISKYGYVYELLSIKDLSKGEAIEALNRAKSWIKASKKHGKYITCSNITTDGNRVSWWYKMDEDLLLMVLHKETSKEISKRVAIEMEAE